MSGIVQETFLLTNSRGDTLNLSSGGIYVMEHDGLGMPRPVRAARAGPYQHGQSLLSARLDARAVTMKLLVQGATESEMWGYLASLQAMLTQIDAAIYLDATLPDGTLKRLEVMYNDGLGGARKSDDLYFTTEQVVQLIADDPILYSPTVVALTFSLGGGAGTFAVPTPVPTAVGASTIDVSQAITYLGTWPSYPLIRLTGPITNAIVRNVSTSEKLDFTGTTIAGGDYYDIDCRYGHKTVLDAAGASKIDKLTTDSDLATFHIERHPAVANGINSLQITGSGINAATKIDLTYWVRYIGL